MWKKWHETRKRKICKCHLSKQIKLDFPSFFHVFQPHLPPVSQNGIVRQIHHFDVFVHILSTWLCVNMQHKLIQTIFCLLFVLISNSRTTWNTKILRLRVSFLRFSDNLVLESYNISPQRDDNLRCIPNTLNLGFICSWVSSLRKLKTLQIAHQWGKVKAYLH